MDSQQPDEDRLKEKMSVPSRTGDSRQADWSDLQRRWRCL